MASIHLCKNCGNPIEPTGGKLYPWTHCNAEQTACPRAEHGAAIHTEQLPVYTLGRIRAVLEMLDKPNVYCLTPEKAIERLREIIAEYRLNTEADRG